MGDQFQISLNRCIDGMLYALYTRGKIIPPSAQEHCAVAIREAEAAKAQTKVEPPKEQERKPAPKKPKEELEPSLKKPTDLSRHYQLKSEIYHDWDKYQRLKKIEKR